MRFPTEFSPDLVARVRAGSEKSGYFMFGRDEDGSALDHIELLGGESS